MKLQCSHYKSLTNIIMFLHMVHKQDIVFSTPINCNMNCNYPQIFLYCGLSTPPPKKKIACDWIFICDITCFNLSIWITGLSLVTEEWLYIINTQVIRLIMSVWYWPATHTFLTLNELFIEHDILTFKYNRYVEF